MLQAARLFGSSTSSATKYVRLQSLHAVVLRNWCWPLVYDQAVMNFTALYTLLLLKTLHV
jgi:hypothetical protein